MRKQALIVGAFIASLGLVGCSTPTEITTTQGETISTSDKPKVDSKDEFIHYKKDGKNVQMHKSEVRKIEEIK